ncbi:unnamed protein product [Ixodes pacificus]
MKSLYNGLWHASSGASYYRSVAGDFAKAVDKNVKGQAQREKDFLSCQ